jgi:hypothetical protein
MIESLENGKPFERAGRKTVGLSSFYRGDMAARSPGGLAHSEVLIGQRLSTKFGRCRYVLSRD